MRITITEHGPYHVSGSVPISEGVITPVPNRHYELRPGQPIDQKDEAYLCRCGGSGQAPFCDGTHARNAFDGTEVADRALYAQRVVDRVKGTTMTLLDDGRCGFARFCHRDRGDVWELTAQDTDPTNRAEALIAASQCPTGRLVEVDATGQALESAHDPEIVALQDPQRGVSAALFVRGPIPVTGADGTDYEVRNRVALCRCGASGNKPFCDATHVSAKYHDKRGTNRA